MPMAMAQPMLAALQQILSGNLLPPAPNGAATAPPPAAPAPAAPPPAPAPGVLQAAPVLSTKVQPPPLLGGNGKMFCDI